MKILSIGNSFSQDAHGWLHKLAAQQGVDLDTVNLYIGGCSLETHWKNVVENNACYSLEPNGEAGVREIGILQALEMDDWDVVTVQQVSHFSGMPETYEPYLSNLVDTVRKLRPNAKILFHQTWAYETDSWHDGFANYNNDQRQMYDRLVAASAEASKRIHAEQIPVGTVIQLLRENIAEFDYAKGGHSLCRDGFHLTLDYGRYAAAATWFVALTGRKIVATEFEDFDLSLLQKITAIINTL